MSDSNGPVKRRRIAGESTPAAKKTPAKKTPAKKAPAKKATATGSKFTSPVKPAAKLPKKVATPTKRVAAPVRQSQTASTSSRDGAAMPRPAAKKLVPLFVAAIMALALGGWASYQGYEELRSNDGDRQSSEKAASSAATAAAETIFSYSFDKLPEHLTESKKLMTASFAKDFEKIAPALDEIAPQRRVQVEAVGRNAAALSCGDECAPGTVNVLVFLDQARLVDGSKQPDVIGNRITMKMVHRGGVWLVADIRAV